MKKKCKDLLLTSALLLIVFVIFTLLLKLVDVRPIGPEGSEVGFAALNKLLTPKPFELLYKLTKYLGYLAVLIAVLYFLLGLYQLITRGRLVKVDKDIIALGIVFALALCFYGFFNIVAVNYRPVLTEDGLDPSYPSSHTILACVLFLSSVPMILNRVKNVKLRNLLLLACYGLTFISVLFRFLCGVHWFTDVVGALLISASLVSFFYGMIAFIKEQEHEA